MRFLSGNSTWHYMSFPLKPLLICWESMANSLADFVFTEQQNQGMVCRIALLKDAGRVTGIIDPKMPNWYMSALENIGSLVSSDGGFNWFSALKMT